jgi:lipopolysaccharide biosynthesis glycosyltransferase
MLQSLFDNNEYSSFHIFILTEGLSEQNNNHFQVFFKLKKHTFTIIHIDNALLKDAPVFGHVSLATYYRILIPLLIPKQIDKALFLDSDIIVKGNVDMFWSVEIESYSHIAIENYGITQEFKQNLGINPHAKYFNAGVMFINLKWWRKENVFQKSLDFISTNSDKITFWDQDVLNALLFGKWLEFPMEYNAQQFLFFGETVNVLKNITMLSAYYNPVIIHYAGSDICKPWYYECTHKYKDEYYKYLQKTEFKNFIPIGTPVEKKLTWRDKFYLFRKNLFKRR